MAKVREVIASFDGTLSSDNFIPLVFLGRYVQNQDFLYVHLSSGVVSARVPLDPNKVVSYRSSLIFKSKSEEDYSAFLPYACGRI